MVGTTISHYKIIEKIGQGGINTVRFYHFDIGSDRTVLLCDGALEGRVLTTDCV